MKFVFFLYDDGGFVDEQIMFSLDKFKFYKFRTDKFDEYYSSWIDQGWMHELE